LFSGNEILIHFDKTEDPVRNMNREEELFKQVESRELPELARFWVNSECLVRGKARSAKYGWYHEELAEELGVRVIQRETGGGVVYHDRGNLNWSFFIRTAGGFHSPAKIFGQASNYMITALDSLGVQAQFSLPNRIDVDNRKVSGMAAKSTRRALLVHGTLLLDSDLDRLNMLCIPPQGCPPVANLSEWAKDISVSKVVVALVAILKESRFRVAMRDSVDPHFVGGISS
jgi:lipoate---protein ligase